nr:ADP dependent glucokinase [Hymenolepis microstoma]
MPFQPPKLEKCVRCEKTVYAVERVEAGGQVWHKQCFRCGICDLVLNLNSYKQADQQLYCGKHYQELVLAKNTQTPVSLTRLETAYHAFPQPEPGPLIIVGFGGCTDITVNAITFLESLGVSSMKTPHSKQKGNSEVELNSLEDIVDEFTQMFAAGAAAERYVQNKELFDSLVFQAIANATNSDELRKDGKRGYLSLGGNAPVMASRLAREGAEVALAARLSAKEAQALPPKIKVLSAPSSYGLPSIPKTDFHLVMEFDKGSSWRNFTAPRANRYILIRDEENPRLSSLWPDLLSSWLDRGDGRAKDVSTSYPDLFVLGGLQTMDNAVVSPDIRGERLEALKHFLSVKLPRATLVHFEMASFVETAFVSNLTRTILPYVDSIGLNEQELPNLRSLLIDGRIASQASESTPRAAVMLDGMREIWSAMTDSSQLPKVGIGLRRLSRLHLHTLGYQIIMVKRPAGGIEFDPEMIARAMKDSDLVFNGKATELGLAWPYTKAAVAKASLIAHRHTCASANVDPDLTRLLMDESFAVTANPARWSSALHCDSSCSVPRIQFNSTSPVSCWFEDEPATTKNQNERSTRVEICVAPVPVCRKVIRTVGGGDNISAAALRTQVIGRRSSHGNR